MLTNASEVRPQRAKEVATEGSLRISAPLILIEATFTLVGGFLDAYAFIAHGHVFANAQTGNVVLFAVDAMTGSWTEAFRHLPPIIACVLGVIAARLLGVQPEKRTFRATLLCQAIELCVLTLLSFLGSSMPDMFIVPVISFAAALQITSFDAVGPYSFNSAMTTGNLKSAASGLTLALLGKEHSKNKAKAFVSGVACVSFLGGALFGAFWTGRHPVHTLVPCVGLVLLGLTLTWREHRAALRAASVRQMG